MTLTSSTRPLYQSPPAVLATARRRSDLYETALTLDGIVALGRASGQPTDELERERTALFDRLGIIEAPTV